MKFMKLTSSANGVSYLLNMEDVSSITPMMNGTGAGTTLNLKNGNAHLVKETPGHITRILQQNGFVLVGLEE